jgi:hypothetical protein
LWQKNDFIEHFDPIIFQMPTPDELKKMINGQRSCQKMLTENAAVLDSNIDYINNIQNVDKIFCIPQQIPV